MSPFPGLGGVVGGEARATAAGLTWPQGDPDALRAAARQAGAAAGLLRASSGGLGGHAAGISGWEGEAAQSFSGAVDRERSIIDGGAGALEGVAGELDHLAQAIEDAQQEVLDQAARIEDAEEETRQAETREAAANLAAAGAGAALDLFGPDPPRALEGEKQDAEDVAGRAGRGAVAARAHEAGVRRRAQSRAREVCQDAIRADQATADVISDAKLGGAVGSGFGTPPGAAFTAAIAKRMDVSDFKELAFLQAGIDPTKWDPRKGLDYNDETVRAVYAYYRRLGLEHGELQWAQLAAIGGPQFYAGFKDLDAAGDTAQKTGLVPPQLNPFALPLALGAGDLKWYEGQFLTMQKAIFSDLAWQHEAFALGGPAAVRRAVGRLPETQRRSYDKTLRAWDGIASGEPKRVADGNLELLRREQLPVIQDYYDEMSDRFTGGPVTDQLTDRADTPVSETYREYTDRGNIANSADRFRWIEHSVWPAHQHKVQTPGAVQELLNRDFDKEVDRYRQFDPPTPKDLAPPLIPPQKFPTTILGG